MNVGNGIAKNLVPSAKGSQGPKDEVLSIIAHSQESVMRKNVPFYWDVYDAMLDENIEITINFTDMNDHPQDSFDYSFIVT